jgi:hypothetical protein
MTTRPGPDSQNERDILDFDALLAATHNDPARSLAVMATAMIPRYERMVAGIDAYCRSVSKELGGPAAKARLQELRSDLLQSKTHVAFVSRLIALSTDVSLPDAVRSAAARTAELAATIASARMSVLDLELEVLKHGTGSERGRTALGQLETAATAPKKALLDLKRLATNDQRRGWLSFFRRK